MKVLLSSLLLLAAVYSVYSQAADCSIADSCDLCVGVSVYNLTGCVWRLCPEDNDVGRCVTDEGDVSDSRKECSWTRVAELCAVVEIVAEEQEEGGSGDDKKPDTKFSQAKFDMSSFIGGIILVMIVQGGGFLAMRFLKSKEQSNYETIEQPQ